MYYTPLYPAIFSLLAGMGLAQAVWFLKRPEGKSIRSKVKEAGIRARTSVMRWMYGDLRTPQGQEKLRLWQLKLKYSGFSELYVRIGSLAAGAVFFTLYLNFSLFIPCALAYAVFGAQLPYLLLEVVAAARESMAVTQTAAFVSAFTDGLEMKLTVNSALNSAGKTVAGPPVGGELMETLHRIRMGGREQESLRALGHKLGNQHLVNFGDVVGQVKRSGADDPAPFRLLEWITQEEEKLQSEFVAEVLTYIIFLSCFALLNLLALPVLKYAFHSLWVTVISIRPVVFALSSGSLLVLYGIRSYAARKVMI